MISEAKKAVRAPGFWREVVNMHLKYRGATPRDIAAILGCSPAYVRATFSRRGLKAPKAVSEKSETMRLSEPVLKVLAPFAHAREITVPQLAERIITIAVRDNMVTAILDDEECE